MNTARGVEQAATNIAYGSILAVVVGLALLLGGTGWIAALALAGTWIVTGLLQYANLRQQARHRRRRRRSS